MSYIQNNLITDEHIVFETKYHWIIYFSFQGLFTLFIAPLIKQMSNEFAVTNKRIVVKQGIIARDTLEMNLSKIESVQVEQSFWARMFGYGTIIIIGTGGTREVFTNIAKPILFRRKFQEMCG
jgi:uncharacterized membrane protein YdbT with pleckstrin-like domain